MNLLRYLCLLVLALSSAACVGAPAVLKGPRDHEIERYNTMQGQAAGDQLAAEMNFGLLKSRYDQLNTKLTTANLSADSASSNYNARRAQLMQYGYTESQIQDDQYIQQYWRDYNYWDGESQTTTSQMTNLIPQIAQARAQMTAAERQQHSAWFNEVRSRYGSRWQWWD